MKYYDSLHESLIHFILVLIFFISSKRIILFFSFCCKMFHCIWKTTIQVLPQHFTYVWMLVYIISDRSCPLSIQTSWDKSWYWPCVPAPPLTGGQLNGLEYLHIPTFRNAVSSVDSPSKDSAEVHPDVTARLPPAQRWKGFIQNQTKKDVIWTKMDPGSWLSC